MSQQNRPQLLELPQTGKTKRSNLTVPLFLSFIAGGILLIGATTYLLVGKAGSQQTVDEIVKVQQRSLTPRFQGRGTLEPLGSFEVTPVTSGRLADLKVRQGQLVQQKEPLAVIQNDELQTQGLKAQNEYQRAMIRLDEARVRLTVTEQQARNQLNQAQGNLEQVVASLPNQKEQIQAQLDRASASLEQQQPRFEAYKKLLEENVITTEEFQVRSIDYFRTKSAMEQLKTRLEAIENNSTPEIRQLVFARDRAITNLQQQQQTAKAEMETLSAAAATAEKELRSLKKQAEGRVVLAPFSGLVTKVDAKIGDTFQLDGDAATKPILRLAKGWEFLVNMPPAKARKLKPGQLVEIVSETHPDQVFRGKVKLVNPQAIEEDGVRYFKLAIDLLSGQDKLTSKTRVKATFVGEPIDNALVVPKDAIVTKDGSKGVVVAGDKKEPEFRPVTLGLTVGDSTQIMTGLESGEEVFLDLSARQQNKLGID